MGEVAAIVLAAGKSTRMKSDLPKVLHELCGRPMLSYVLNACRLAGVDRLIVVIGHGKEKVMQTFEHDHDITWVEQTEQRGTGHAVLCCKEALGNFEGTVIVIAGDMPLVRRETLCELIDARETGNLAVTIATTYLDDPTGYGRIVRDEEGMLQRIVEHRDCTEEEREINEVNPSYYCFDAQKMLTALQQLKPSASKGELYLTDAIAILREHGDRVSAEVIVPDEEATGINSRLDLTHVGRLMQDRLQRELLEEGVSIVDPDNTWIESDVTIGAETVIYPFTYIGAGATIGSNCKVGPHGFVAPRSSIHDGGVVGSFHAMKEGNS